jgi:Protein of unknown function (DUF4089)
MTNPIPNSQSSLNPESADREISTSPDQPSSNPALSCPLANYVDEAAQLIGLSIPAEYRQSVIENFQRIAAIAALVNDFPLTQEIESAPVFEP